jgi:hypothetical protein
MATLYDLAMQYLAQALPSGKIFPDTIPPLVPPAEDTPVQPEEGILGTQVARNIGADNYSVYNPDPTRLRTADQYSPFAYRQASEKTFYDTTTAANKMMDMYPDYYGVGQKSGIERLLSKLPGQQILKGITDALPVNRRAIIENEALGAGFRLNDIGQIVAAPGSAYDPSGLNIMAGYNLAKIDQSTFDKRRERAKKNMTPEGYEEFNKALTAAEEKILGAKGIKSKADLVFDDKSLKKDPTYKTFDQLVSEGLLAGDDDDDDLTYEEVQALKSQFKSPIPTGITSAYPGMGITTGGGNIYDEVALTSGGGGITNINPTTGDINVGTTTVGNIYDEVALTGGGNIYDEVALTGGGSTTPDYSNVTTGGPPSQGGGGGGPPSQGGGAVNTSQGSTQGRAASSWMDL